MILHPLTPDFTEELLNIEMSKRLRWADKLKMANEFDLAEVVFPDTPDFDVAEIARRSHEFEPQHELERAA